MYRKICGQGDIFELILRNEVIALPNEMTEEKVLCINDIRVCPDYFVEDCFQSYYHSMLLYAEAKVLDEEIAQDIVQDVFLELVSQVSRVIEHPNPGGWIKLTTKNKIHEYERRIRNNKRRFLSLNAIPYEPASYIEISAGEDVFEIMKQIKKILSEDEYQFFKQLVYEETPHKEMAMRRGISETASRKRLERIRKKIKSFLH